MKTAVIYGSTATGKQIYSQIKEKYKILFFTDENPALIGKKNFDIEIKNRESIFEANPDVVIMGILTGYEEAVAYLMDHGISEENIIVKYVDLPLRARIDCLVKISSICREKQILGAVAELGVYRGDFARIINQTFPDRKLYLFDTFEGFPESDMNYEIENKLLLNEVGKLSNTSVEYVLGRMPIREQCIIRQGYFPDTAQGLEETFAYAGAKKAIEEFAGRHKVGFIPIGDTFSIAFVKGGLN